MARRNSPNTPGCSLDRTRTSTCSADPELQLRYRCFSKNARAPAWNTCNGARLSGIVKMSIYELMPLMRYDVGPSFAGRGNRLFAVIRLSNDLPARMPFQNRTSRSHRFMIVSYKNPFMIDRTKLRCRTASGVDTFSSLPFVSRKPPWILYIRLMFERLSGF